jgi:hypothetical protein
MFFLSGAFAVKAGLAQMLKGGIIMDVVSEYQARVAEEAGVIPFSFSRLACVAVVGTVACLNFCICQRFLLTSFFPAGLCCNGS